MLVVDRISRLQTRGWYRSSVWRLGREMIVVVSFGLRGFSFYLDSVRSAPLQGYEYAEVIIGGYFERV